MDYKYTSLADVLQALNDERVIYEHQVAPSVIHKRIYCACAGWPGCLPETRGYYSQRRLAEREAARMERENPSWVSDVVQTSVYEVL